LAKGDSMSNIYTIRPTSEESDNIKNLMEHYNVLHASKALLLAANDLPELQKQHNELMTAYKNVTDQYMTLVQAVKERNAVELKINSLIETE
jgi:trimethylamine:corrinoid methyltransferase-like protein